MWRGGGQEGVSEELSYTVKVTSVASCERPSRYATLR